MLAECTPKVRLPATSASTRFIFLAIVLDEWSRQVSGWSIGGDLRTELVLAALDMALMQRAAESLVFHSDNGCQYTSVKFAPTLRPV